MLSKAKRKSVDDTRRQRGLRWKREDVEEIKGRETQPRRLDICSHARLVATTAQ